MAERVLRETLLECKGRLQAVEADLARRGFGPLPLEYIREVLAEIETMEHSEMPTRFERSEPMAE